MTRLIERGTLLPARHTEIFTTAEDRQPSVEIKVLQGEREAAADNKRLGVFEFQGLAPAPARVPQIEVTFEVELDGTVRVSARDLSTGKTDAASFDGATTRAGADGVPAAAPQPPHATSTQDATPPSASTGPTPTVHPTDGQSPAGTSGFPADVPAAEPVDSTAPRQTVGAAGSGVPGGDRRWDFFISYTAADAAWANWIAWQLDQSGYSVIVQAWHMVPGSNWTTMMEDAIRQSTRTIAVLSHSYLHSIYGRSEWQAAYLADPTGFTRKLIPVRVSASARPGLLGSIVSVDLFDLGSDAARAELLRAVKAAVAGHDKPQRPPAFPGPPGTTRVGPARPRHDDEPAFPVA